VIRGKLSVCATPIGNLGDTSFRLLETLRSADMVLAEDTRRTRKLLAHFDLHVPLVCLERHREQAMISFVQDQLLAGKHLALLSDAGTPGLADPGQLLIPALIQSNFDVDYIPGPSAVIAALVLSGLPLHSHLFHAYPPSKPGPRKRLFKSLSSLKATLVFFESPFRLRASLEDMRETLGDRRAVVCREMTKVHQEIWRGTLSELLRQLSLRKNPPLGEITVVVAGASAADLTVAESE
jgi:16S rRNA (cytidine1402-2'-O)-methyltransferase